MWTSGHTLGPFNLNQSLLGSRDLIWHAGLQDLLDSEMIFELE